MFLYMLKDVRSVKNMDTCKSYCPDLLYYCLAICQPSTGKCA